MPRPGLTERLLDARVQMLGQALDDVTALVDLAALDGDLAFTSRHGTEGDAGRRRIGFV